MVYSDMQWPGTKAGPPW